MSEQRGKILQDALAAINRKDADYGKPEDNFANIAALWTAYLDILIEPEDVALMMCLFKIAREKTGVGKKDNLADLCGYAALAAEMQK